MNLEQIDQEVFKEWQQIWNLKYLHPDNLETEKKKFFESDNYEPHFTYQELDFDSHRTMVNLVLLQRQLGNHLEETPVARLMMKKIAKLRSWIDILDARGTEKFTKHSIEYYGKPSEALVHEAQKLIVLKSEQEDATLSSTEVVAKLQEEAKKLGLDCKVEEKEGLASRADCVMPERTLYIRKGAVLSERNVQKLAVHELGVHARRATKGEQHPFKLFVMGTAEYETTEEGLAGLKEEEAGVSSTNSLRTKGALTLAVDLALQHGFRTVYNYLREHFNEESAFRLTLKVKRGLGDTSQPGAFTKDYIYLKGLRLVKDLPPEQVEKLFIGRVAVEDLPVLETLQLN